MSAHTKGPWSICYDGQLDGADGTRVMFLPFDSHKEFNDLPDTFKANLRLISAAPELLAAAELVLAWYEAEEDHSKADFYKRIDMCRESEIAIRSSIAKATGGAA